jgi:pimeloyl-ACP methyl ester carboxylesterase
VKKAAFWSLAVIALAAAGYFSGPRVKVDTTITFNPLSIGDDPEAYLAEEEEKIPGIREGQQKQIVWADPQSRRKTPISIIYIHGFSASSGEIRPLPDMVAEDLGANLFFTRLRGHGRDGPAMAEASVHDWVNDMAEALAIGRRIGDKVIVMATSTGGSLATWAATKPGLMDRVAGFVLFSPNYGVKATGAELLAMPWGGQMAELLIGKQRSFTAHNEKHAALWTSSYPTKALLPFAGITELALAAKVETISIPALFIFSEQDNVVRPEITAQMAERWGAPTSTILVENSGDPDNHIIAGDALSPDNTIPLAKAVEKWIKNIH